MLKVDGVGFFAKGDIHAVKAKQKTGKSTSATRQHIIGLIEAGLLKEYLDVVRLASDKEKNEE